MRVLQTKSETKAFYDKIAEVYDLLAEHSEHPMRESGLSSSTGSAGRSSIRRRESERSGQAMRLVQRLGTYLGCRVFTDEVLPRHFDLVTDFALRSVLAPCASFPRYGGLRHYRRLRRPKQPEAFGLDLRGSTSPAATAFTSNRSQGSSSFAVCLMARPRLCACSCVSRLWRGVSIRLAWDWRPARAQCRRIPSVSFPAMRSVP